MNCLDYGMWIAISTVISSVCEQLLEGFGLVSDDDVLPLEVFIECPHSLLKQRVVERRLIRDGGVRAAGCVSQRLGR